MGERTRRTLPPQALSHVPQEDAIITSTRSSCPVNRAVELLGDRWSLLLLRDVVVHDRRTFRELLTGNEEGIPAPALSRRLSDLTAAGFLTKEVAPRGKQGRYSLTELGIATVPVLVALGRLGACADPTTADHAPGITEGDLPARLEELRARHLGPTLPSPERVTF